MTFVCAKWLLAPSIQAKKSPSTADLVIGSSTDQVNRRQWHSRALLANAVFSTRRIFTACPLNSNFPLQLSPPSARHTRSSINDSITKMLAGEEEEGMVSAGWAVHQYASRDTGSLALLLLAAVPFPHWLWLKPFSLLIYSPPPWDLPLNYASFALPRVYLPKGSMWPVVCILV